MNQDALIIGLSIISILIVIVAVIVQKTRTSSAKAQSVQSVKNTQSVSVSGQSVSGQNTQSVKSVSGQNTPPVVVPATPVSGSSNTQQTTSSTKNSYTRGVGVPMVCPDGMVEDGGLCYEPPHSGYSCTGLICSENCPSGWTDGGLVCNKPTTPNGAGVPMICAQGQEMDAGLCYTPCPSNMTGVGPLCWGACPSGYTDTGALCTRPADTIVHPRYSRGAGTIPALQPCAPGLRDDGTSCWEDLKCSTVDNGYYNYSWGCGTSIVPCYDGSTGCKDNCYRTWIPNLQTVCTGCGCIKTTLMQRQTCPSGQEMVGGLCYPICQSGYTSSAGDVMFCTDHSCPAGYTDTGLTCYRGPDTVAKATQTRAAGVPVSTCPSGTVKDPNGALCYPNCPAGQTGAGPVCWSNCPPGYTDTGAFCQKPTYTRSVGIAPSVCPAGTVKDPSGLLCYPACQSGYSGVGPVCWENFDDFESRENFEPDIA